MSLITQCPACATMFRIVPDQLRISEGWVRCGQCEEVFDANLHLSQLQERLLPKPPAASLPAPPEPEAAIVESPVAEVPAPAAVPEAQPAGEVPQEPPARQHDDAPPGYNWMAPAPQPAAEPAYDWSSVLSLPPAEAMADTMLLPLDIPSVLPEPADKATASDTDPVDSVQPGLDGAAGQQDSPSELAPLSFMASKAAKPDTGLRPWQRALGAMGCALLVLALGLQGMLHNREQIAARAPALRPLLLSACELLGCSLHAPQDIDAIAIDSSAFTSVRPGVYLLHATLKSSAPTDLQMPALELTLTNAQDQAVLRRVLLPADLQAQAVLAAGTEFSASVPLQVQTDAVGERIAGYKLLAFYP